MSVRVGILGCGNVGSSLVELIDSGGPEIEERTGVSLQVAKIAVRNLAAHQGAITEKYSFTADPYEVVEDPDIDVIVEVIGGIEPARDLILKALKLGKPVVTANKELLASTWSELFEAALSSGVDLLYEASVAGAVPLVRSLRESLPGDRIVRIMGIVNGTTNFILTKMSEEGATYADALAEAQELGFAEANPTADVGGFDAAAKAAIVATIAFGCEVTASDVYTEGISALTADDILMAAKLGYVVKLLAVAERSPEAGPVAVHVHPAMVPVGHPLAGVRGSFNAVFIEGEAIGDMMLYGRGAGGMPTAAAVLGDLIDAAHNLKSGGIGRVSVPPKAQIRPMDELVTQYFVSMDVIDEPGVLADVAAAFGKHGVSIRSMEQLGRESEAHLIFLTHIARERDVQATCEELRSLPSVESVGNLIRVIGGEG